MVGYYFYDACVLIGGCANGLCDVVEKYLRIDFGFQYAYTRKRYGRKHGSGLVEINRFLLIFFLI